MLRFLLSAAVLLGAGFASANELDRNPVNEGLKGTVVVRVDQRTNAVAIAQADVVPATEAQAQALASKAAFSPVAPKNLRGELDNDGGASSWYWCNYGYNYGYLYWYGYSYNSYYSYSYGYYSYYYYGRRW